MGKLSKGITNHSPSLDGGRNAQKKQYDIFSGGGQLTNKYYFNLNLDERGEYSADVIGSPNGVEVVVFEIDTDTAHELIEDGFLKYKPDQDIEGLEKHLKDIGIIPDEATLYPSEQDMLDTVDDNLIEYTIPQNYAVALINADESGLSDEESEELSGFVQGVMEQYGNAYFTTGGEESFESRFENSNDVNGFASDVVTLYINPETDNEETDDHLFSRGGAIYEVNRLGEEDRPLTESMMSAKNLTQLREKVQEKYGTTKGFRVEKRDKSGRMVSVKFDEGGDTRSEILGAFKRGKLRNDKGELVTDKNEAYNMIYLADLRSNPAKYAYSGGGSTNPHSTIRTIDGVDYLISLPRQDTKGNYVGWYGKKVFYDIKEGEKHIDWDRTRYVMNTHPLTNAQVDNAPEVDDYFSEGGGLTDKEANKFERILKNSARILSEKHPEFPEHIMFGGKKVYLTFVYDEVADPQWDNNAQANIDNFKKHGLSSTVKHSGTRHGLYQEINPNFGFGGIAIGVLIGGLVGYGIGKRVGYGRAFQGYSGGGEIKVKKDFGSGINFVSKGVRGSIVSKDASGIATIETSNGRTVYVHEDYLETIPTTYQGGGEITEQHRKNLTDRLWNERGYDIPYLSKLNSKELKSLYDTEFYYEDKGSTYQGGGDLLSSVSDMLPHSEPMGIIDPINIADTVTPMARGGQIQEASAKWNKVMSEFKDGTLKHGTTGDVVTDRKMAMAIAYSEAQEIYPKYGKFDGGGKIEKEVNLMMDNSEIERMVDSYGTDRLKYSQAQLQELSSYSYPLRLSNDLVNKLWGLAMKYGFGGYKRKKILVFNVGNGDLLRYITDDVLKVDAVEPNHYLNKISKILFGSNKINLSNFTYDDSMGRAEGIYDLSIGVVSSGVDVANNSNQMVKKGGLYIVVAPSEFMDKPLFEKERNEINQKYDLQVAYRLPNDIMPNFDVIVLKKK